MRTSLLLGAALLVASCTVQKEEEFDNPAQHRYHAVAEDAVDAETRVFTDSKLRVRWNEGDHISIFERNTYNQEFEFLGDTGDTAGDFDPMESSGYHSSGDIEDGYVYAVYPYEKKNKCDFDGKLTVTFPSVQHYKKDSFGVGANVMVAKTNTLDLRFMHVGGYRTFKLYGEGVSVSSVRIESNGSEYLAGRTDVVIGEDGKPAVSFIESTSNLKSVELVCDTPVALGTTDADAVEFWFVLPPGTLTQGFTVTVTDENGNEFAKSTSNVIEVKSGVKKSMPAFKVEIENEQPNNVIYYTSSDGEVVNPVNIDCFGAEFIGNEYTNGRGIITFDSDVTTIGDDSFTFCSTLTSIMIPKSVRSIGERAFSGCSGLTSIDIPESVTELRSDAFRSCTGLTSVVIPESVSVFGDDNPFALCSSLSRFSGNSVSNDGRCVVLNNCIVAFAPFGLTEYSLSSNISRIGNGAFSGCKSLSSIALPNNLTCIGDYAFAWCDSLRSIDFPESLIRIENRAFVSCTSLVSIELPDGLLVLGDGAFYNCTSLASIKLSETIESIGRSAFSRCSYLDRIVIPASVTSIGSIAFEGCSNLSSITLEGAIPPVCGGALFVKASDCPAIFVPFESVNLYKLANIWCEYANRIQAIPGTAGSPLDGFNPNNYLIYRANPTSFNEGRDFYHIESNMPGISGAKVEMKFQLAEGSKKTLANDNIESDYDEVLHIKDGNLTWEKWRDDGVLSFSIPLNNYGIRETDLIVLFYDSSKSSFSVNNQSFVCQLGQMSFRHLFVEYYREYDEGARTVYHGIPDGSKLYYVKTWDENDNLTYIGYATSLINPKSSNVEYCWYSFYPETGETSYVFANDAENQGGFNGFSQ